MGRDGSGRRMRCDACSVERGEKEGGGNGLAHDLRIFSIMRKAVESYRGSLGIIV